MPCGRKAIEWIVIRVTKAAKCAKERALLLALNGRYRVGDAEKGWGSPV